METQQRGYKVSISMDYNPNVLFSVFVIIGIHQRNPSTKISMDLFSTSEEKINSNAEYKFISDGGLYNREAIFRIGFSTTVENIAYCGSFSHVQTVIVIFSAGWEQQQPASFQNNSQLQLARSPQKNTASIVAIRLSIGELKRALLFVSGSMLYHSHSTKSTQLYFTFPADKRRYIDSTRHWTFIYVCMSIM